MQTGAGPRIQVKSLNTIRVSSDSELSRLGLSYQMSHLIHRVTALLEDSNLSTISADGSELARPIIQGLLVVHTVCES